MLLSPTWGRDCVPLASVSRCPAEGLAKLGNRFWHFYWPGSEAGQVTEISLSLSLSIWQQGRRSLLSCLQDPSWWASNETWCPEGFCALASVRKCFAV